MFIKTKKYLIFINSLNIAYIFNHSLSFKRTLNSYILEDNYISFANYYGTHEKQVITKRYLLLLMFKLKIMLIFPIMKNLFNNYLSGSLHEEMYKASIRPFKRKKIAKIIINISNNKKLTKKEKILKIEKQIKTHNL